MYSATLYNNRQKQATTHVYVQYDCIKRAYYIWKSIQTHVTDFNVQYFQ